MFCTRALAPSAPMFTPRANHAMLTLLPVHRNETRCQCVLFSPNDTPEALEENVLTTVGLHPALKPAVRISSTNPLVPLGSIEGQQDLTDTDSVIKSLDVLLMEAGKYKWQHFEHAHCNVVVDCSGPDGTVELLRSLRGTHELNQTHRLVADQTALEISFKPSELPPSVFIVNHGVSGHVFELEPHKTIGDLQACCADTFNVLIDRQARNRLTVTPCIPHPHASPITPHSRRFSWATCVSMSRAGRSARSTSCTSSCGNPEAAPSS